MWWQYYNSLTPPHHVVHCGRLEGVEGVEPAGGEGGDEGHRHRHLGPVAAHPGHAAAHILNLRSENISIFHICSRSALVLIEQENEGVEFSSLLKCHVFVD